MKELHPFSKEELYQFTKSHPHVLDLYKEFERRERESSDQNFDESFSESAFCDALSAALRQIPAGAAAASDFHSLMIGAIEFLFYPQLIYPTKEREIHAGRKRIDITYTNAARDGFFYRVHTAHQVASNIVMVECKNYVSDVANPELDQLSGRFSANRGKLGILIARSCSDRTLFVTRCRDTAHDGRGFIIPLFDEDIHAMLEAIKYQRRKSIDARLDAAFNELL